MVDKLEKATADLKARTSVNEEDIKKLFIILDKQSGKDKHCRDCMEKLERMKTSEEKKRLYMHEEKYIELGEKIEKISNEVKTLKENNHMVQLKKQNFVEEKISKLNYLKGHLLNDIEIFSEVWGEYLHIKYII